MNFIWWLNRFILENDSDPLAIDSQGGSTFLLMSVINI